MNQAMRKISHEIKKPEKFKSVQSLHYNLKERRCWSGLLFVQGEINVTMMNGEIIHLNGRFPSFFIEDFLGIRFY